MLSNTYVFTLEEVKKRKEKKNHFICNIDKL